MAATAALVLGAFLPLPAQAPPGQVAQVGAQAPEVHRELDAVLQRRSDALLRHDEAGFLSSIDPAAPAEFRDRQLALFRNIAEVPLRSWDYDVQQASSGDPARPEIQLSYAIDGVDAVPTRRPVDYGFARRDGRWYLADDPATWHGPWDYGPCRVVRTAHGVIIGHDGTGELSARLAAEVDAAVEEVTRVWGPWRRQVGVLLPQSQEELSSLVGAEFAVDGIAAVTVADEVDVSTKRVEGPRIVVNTDTAARLSDLSLRVVLQHEIAHVAARADTAEGAPMWLMEGFADYVGYRNSGLPPERVAPDLRAQVSTGELPAGPPGESDFHQAGRRLDLAYQESWSLVDHLVRRIGEPRMVALYRRIAGAGSAAAVDPALREIAGTDRASLLRDWRGELLRRFG